jgi:hypothetical protein
MRIKFHSDFYPRGVLSTYTQDQVKQEPMLFSADVRFALEHGGLITREFISRLPGDWYKDYIIDSRVHMLMPGWYPCIPGWHLDDVPRTRPDGQPDHAHPAYKASNIMAIVGDASITEFIKGNLELEDVGFNQGAVYGTWNAEINKRLAEQNCQISIRKVPELTLIDFKFGAFHRGVPATKNGWRFFIRANYNTARKVMNEVRQQTQVYLPVPESGW